MCYEGFVLISPAFDGQVIAVNMEEGQHIKIVSWDRSEVLSNVFQIVVYLLKYGASCFDKLAELLKFCERELNWSRGHIGFEVEIWVLDNVKQRVVMRDDSIH